MKAREICLNCEKHVPSGKRLTHLAIRHQNILREYYSEKLDFEALLAKIDERVLGEIDPEQFAHWTEKHKIYINDWFKL